MTMPLQDLVAAVAGGLANAARKPSVLNYIPNEHGQTQFHKSTSIGRLLVGSNRSGKSIAGCTETVFRLMGRHPYQRVPEPPVKGRVLTVNFDSGAKQIIEPLLQQWIPPSELKNGSWDDSYNKREHILRLRNGSELEIKSHDQSLDSMAGVPRHFLWCDKNPPQDIFKESRTRLLDYNGCYFITMTPVEGMTWIYDELVLKDENNVELIEISILDNPHVSEEARDMLSKDLTPEERAIRIDGKFVPKGGLILKEFKYDKHVINSGLPALEWVWYGSIDHGYNNPTAIYWHAVTPLGIVITFKEHYRAGWTIKMHANKIHEINRILGKVPEFFVCDPSMSQRQPTTGVSLLHEYRDAGIPVVPGKKDVPARINRMNEYFRQDKWYITQECPNLIREFRTYSWKVYNSTKIADRSNKREEPNKKNDHGVDSCGYLFSFMPDLRPLSLELPHQKPKLSKTRTNPTEFPWTIDEGLYRLPEPDLSYGEIP